MTHSTLQFLLKEIEHCTNLMDSYQTESKSNLDWNRVLVAYDFDSRYVAIKHYKEHLESLLPENLNR